MLEGLDDVDWASLEHCYGSAKNVPDMLRRFAAAPISSGEWRAARAKIEGTAEEQLLRILSGEPVAKVEEHPIGDLYLCLCYSGEIFSASAAAVPFLIEIAATPAVAVRADALTLVADIGTGYPMIPGTVPGQAAEAEAELRSAARQAVAAGLPAYLALLDDPAEDVRRAAAYALASLHKERAPALAALWARYAVEEETPVRAALLAAWGRLTRADPEPDRVFLRSAADEGEPPLLRFVAAVALARRDPPVAPPVVVAVLQAALAGGFVSDGEYHQTLSEAHNDVYLDALECIQPLRPGDVEATLEQMLAQLDGAGANRDGLQTPVLASIDFAFGHGADDDGGVYVPIGEPRDPATLTARQRRVLHAFAASDAFWENGMGVFLQIHARGVPHTREELQWYLAT